MKSFVNKPWGSYQVIDQGENFVVKRIVVNPYGKLSLQSHKHRSEYWIIVEGTAEVTINDNITTLESNQSTYIPSETKHRLANNYEKNLILIEVWYGKNLDEEDITRYEDIYNRV
jgi:mannose-6-phosphate isomerase-like protein (cupin superfamily)